MKLNLIFEPGTTCWCFFQSYVMAPADPVQLWMWEERATWLHNSTVAHLIHSHTVIKLRQRSAITPATAIKGNVAYIKGELT